MQIHNNHQCRCRLFPVLNYIQKIVYHFLSVTGNCLHACSTLIEPSGDMYNVHVDAHHYISSDPFLLYLISKVKFSLIVVAKEDYDAGRQVDDSK